MSPWYVLKDISIVSSGGHFSAEKNGLSNFGRDQYEEYLCEIMSIWTRRHLKVYVLALGVILISGVEWFVQSL